MKLTVWQHLLICPLSKVIKPNSAWKPLFLVQNGNMAVRRWALHKKQEVLEGNERRGRLHILFTLLNIRQSGTWYCPLPKPRYKWISCWGKTLEVEFYIKLNKIQFFGAPFSHSISNRWGKELNLQQDCRCLLACANHRQCQHTDERLPHMIFVQPSLFFFF